MDRIFLAAQYVIIALHGTGVNYGLPGVGYAHRAWQSQIRLADMIGTNLSPSRLKEESAVWQTREWTYQECVLALRRLYFTNSRVYFECEQSVLYEDMYILGDALGDQETHKLLLTGEGSEFAAYERHVRNYATRQLSHRNDSCLAFAGIHLAFWPKFYASWTASQSF
jgi:hypothetical protein